MRILANINRATWFVGVFFVVNILLTACNQPSANSSAQPSPTETGSPAAQLAMDNYKDYKPRLNGKATVEMMVNGKPIIVEVDGENAPVTAGNFVDLVEQGFYNGLVFHRVVDGFVAQGGDPKGDGTGGYVDKNTQRPRNIPLEIKIDPSVENAPEEPLYGQPVGQQGGYSSPPVVLPHKTGAVAMARSQMPDSASSQFYFTLSDETSFLDGDYAVFGYVTQGMDVVLNIKQGDKIQSAKVIEGQNNLQR
ncbi:MULTISPECIES: peptidylprolyl isomerase [unclassified Synechocystis]|uniref:peptidylprolyl isomerase n=1 Tax=unclassified Synechocystis TaxID=2640012 RepID=UPI00041F7DDB|nr:MULTISPECIES: peptidylprolyl isomerase [unclassified Synechocystis]AIE72945.1 Peptidyl-prolyl cis-trans isomerase [Synechocystis sp. PCC 6714]MCT0252578.1 peptidylprolyl isomerase [Synechocystis sp. CS-94]